MPRLIALILLIALLPVFAAIAVAIKLTSPGPVFFCQRRIGYRRREFCLWKFRTMVASDEPHPTPTLPLDPRITPVGRVLRRFHLDELPQLWNILVGEMAFVGPRPLTRERILARLSYYNYLERYSVLPGLTGPLQVRDPIWIRDHPSAAWRIEHRFIQHRTWRSTLVIIAQTMQVVCMGPEY